jgi:hypothetical protein
VPQTCPQVWLGICPRNRQQCWRDIIAAVSPPAESYPVPNRPLFEASDSPDATVSPTA